MQATTQEIITNTRVAKWGNSQATRISQEVLEKAGAHVGQEFNISVQDGNIILSPVEKKPTTIKELFAGWEDDGFRPGELDWGSAQGNELSW